MTWEKIDKFILVLTAILVLMSTLFVLSVRGVISTFLISRELNPGLIGPEVRVDKEKLTEAYNFVFSRNIVKLETPQQ